jgi:hypothetical protein
LAGVDGLTITQNTFSGSNTGKGIKIDVAYYDSSGVPWPVGEYSMKNIVISENYFYA